MNNDELTHEIIRLKKEHNAVIIAHLYQWPEVQDIADFVGDSLDLSKKAKSTDADMIVFCGVWFMAETAKILSPGKTVLLPELNAGCPMADMITPEDVLELKRRHPGAAVVCYVNSSAHVKAVSDICCTSSNAVKVVSSLKEKEIIFIPDRNLGNYVSRFLPEKKFVLFDGFCPTHNKITPADVIKAKEARPGTPVLVHPECVPEVVDLADFTGSTSQIIDYAMKSEKKEFIIGTEIGVLHRLEKLAPGKKFYALHAAMVCPNMKKTTLNSVYNSLMNVQYKIELDDDTIARAKTSLDRMLMV
ncbi:MAG: quinolinate synthase NadA [Saccharofermentanales bacterium]